VKVAAPNRLRIAAGASLLASLLLIAVALVSPTTALAPFMVANWCLFILTGYFALLPTRWPASVGSAEISKLKLFMLVLIAFTLASWIALAKARTLL
jgi:hypothetical protein